MKTALGDRFFKLRGYALGKLDMQKQTVMSAVEPLVAGLAAHDPSHTVRAQAIALLGKYKKTGYRDLFMQNVHDSSYTVAGNALEALSMIDSAAALGVAKQLVNEPAKGKLMGAISGVLVQSGDASSFELVTGNFEKMQVGQAKFNMVQPYAFMLTKVRDMDKLKKGVDLLTQFRDAIPAGFRSQTDPYFNNTLKGLVDQKMKDGLADQAEYIRSKMTK